MAFTNLEKTDMVLMCGETRGETFPQRIPTSYSQFMNLCKRCAASLRDFERLEINKRDLGCQREEAF
jgi:hypothetical protein